MLRFKSKTIALSDIQIPKRFETTYPHTSKITECYDCYRQHGFFDRAIIVDQGKALQDGYVAYLVARMLGVEQVKAVEISGVEYNRAQYGTEYHPAKVALPAEKPKYKVGDKVRVIGNGHPVTHFVPIGETCTALEACENKVRVDKQHQIIYLADVGPYAEAEPPKKPESPTEPMKLYCIKTDRGWCTKGKIYEFIRGDIQLESGGHEAGLFDDYNDFRNRNRSIAACLVPLVSRPAKAGDWVYIARTKEPCVGYAVGDVFRVEAVLKAPGVIDKPYWVIPTEYLVLDGWAGPEKTDER